MKKIDKNEAKKILNLMFKPNDLTGFWTIKEYLKELLSELFTWFDGFNAKRPFGNSDWEYDIAKRLIEEGLLEGEIDEFGCPYDFDHEEFSQIMREVIKAL